jgi:hypothetical protein
VRYANGEIIAPTWRSVTFWRSALGLVLGRVATVLVLVSAASPNGWMIL